MSCVCLCPQLIILCVYCLELSDRATVSYLDDDVGVPFFSKEEHKLVVGGPPPPPFVFSEGVLVLGVRKVGCCCKALGLGV